MPEKDSTHPLVFLTLYILLIWNALMLASFFSYTIYIMTLIIILSSTKMDGHILRTNNQFGITHFGHRLHLWTTGNRRLEIYCHGLGSLVLVAVYIGMHYGDGWNYSESSITLWYERTYWCEAFRNSKIHNLVLE